MDATRNPFTLDDLVSRLGPVSQKVALTLQPLLERALGLRELAHRYDNLIAVNPPAADAVEFLERFHNSIGINYEATGETISRVPKSGPLIVVANHPFGAVEATVLIRALRSVRPDVKFMANYILDRIPQTREFCLFVDPFGADGSAKKNLQPIRETIDWVQKGGLLVVFPAGTVSHYHWRRREITDPEWSPTVGRIIRKAKAPVLPIYFPGNNGWFFQGIGLVHPLLRTTLLPRELSNKRNSTIKLKVGNPIPYNKLNGFVTDEQLINYLRLRTYILANNAQENPRSMRFFFRRAAKARYEQPVVLPTEVKLLAADFEQLPKRQILFDGSGDMCVAYARARQIPNILREIGRLRELSFRAVQEGTGKEIDLDRFDRYYIHLFIWNRKTNEVVGAYRLAKTDQVIRHFGKNGLYTSTLFAYPSSLPQQLGGALELGRSFVRIEYQKNYSPLLLLWRGIGHYVAQNPRYHTLFGPVSINNEYDSVSLQLITTFLRANNFLPELAKLIRARNPVRQTRIPGVDTETTSIVVKDLSEISVLLQEMESRQKSVPILLRQYLKLGGKLLGFNVDKGFGDVLDGLICVDLRDTDPKLLERYLGKEGAYRFLTFHERDVSRMQATGTE